MITIPLSLTVYGLRRVGGIPQFLGLLVLFVRLSVGGMPWMGLALLQATCIDLE